MLCVAGLCLVAGLVVLLVLLGGASAGTAQTPRPYQPDEHGFDPFELHHQSDEFADESEDNEVYYHRNWMELHYRNRRGSGPFSR